MSEKYESNAEQLPRSLFGKIGQKVLNALKTPEKLRLVKDSGCYTVNKGELIGDPNRLNEDSSVNGPKDGLFAVFDGVGGEANGAKASGTAAEELIRLAKERPIQRQQDLLEIMQQMSEAVRQKANGGKTTAVVGQIIQKGDKKYLLYAWSGDSRIYHIRNSKAEQITEDDGIGNIITKCLGMPEQNEQPARTGTLPLEEGDHLLFCSDGITGDYEKDFISNSLIAHTIEHSKSAVEAAKKLTDIASKIDDRTALVVEI